MWHRFNLVFFAIPYHAVSSFAPMMPNSAAVVSYTRSNASSISSNKLVDRVLFPASIDKNIVSWMSTGGAENNLQVDEGESLQSLFFKYSDKDGFMTKDSLQNDIPAIRDLLAFGDLLQEELDDIWNAVPKFSDMDGTVERIDVKSFLQIYRDIDDIFEDEESEQDDSSFESKDTRLGDDLDENLNEEEFMEDNVARDKEELNRAFRTICDPRGLVSKNDLKNWNEVKALLVDSELSENEFDDLWERIPKSNESTECINLDGFLSFNFALDELFEFVDDENISDMDVAEPKEISMFYGDDLPPSVIFSQIANDDGLVGMNELKKWGDLQDMLKDGDLLPLELRNMLEAIPKAKESNEQLDEEGFSKLHEAIYALFEEDDSEETNVTFDESKIAEDSISSTKETLLDLIEDLAMDADRMICGLDSTDDEVQLVLESTRALEKESSNMVNKDIEIQPSDVAGEWELIYTSSSTMKFNKSLSGLVPPNGKFGGLIQKLKASKYLSDAEYLERINAGPASFEVRVTGDWELRNSVSLFTGSKSVCINVIPDKVIYGLTTQKADHWKSLGPMNLLDISYLDKDLRIMRGTTSNDSIFIFKRLEN